MDWFGQTLKYALYVFNFAFMLCGVFLVTMGGLLLSNLYEINALKDDDSPAALPICIIVLGCVIFAVSFFGCFGAIRQNIYCIYMYAAFLFIFFILELILIIFMYLTRQEYVNTMTRVVSEAWYHNNAENNFPMREIEIQYKCCGLNNYEDYTNAELNVPSSCCGYAVNKGCPMPIYKTRPGCFAQLQTIWSINANIIVHSGIGIAIVEFVALVCTFLLAANIRKKNSIK